MIKQKGVGEGAEQTRGRAMGKELIGGGRDTKRPKRMKGGRGRDEKEVDQAKKRKRDRGRD